jgi:urease accessory protein
LEIAIQSARDAGIETHQCVVFGLIGSTLEIDAETTVLAYLHQSTTTLISACQRLLPLGQSAAMQLLWQLKPLMIAVSEQSREAAEDIANQGSFTPLVDVSAARHPGLRTRLFIS